MNWPPASLPPALADARADVAVVLGSGLGILADALKTVATIPYEDIPGLPVSKVPGHAGRFVVSEVGGKRVLLAQGRVHLYEGWKANEVVRGVELMHSLGIRALILTNAAGSLNPAFAPGCWMMLSDHLNLTGSSPLTGGPNFFDMSEVYSRRLRALFQAAAGREGASLHEGVYAALPGPQYETPAEIRMLQRLGADAVGMSTVPEAIRARSLGMETAGFSCLTNWGAGLSPGELSHEEVTTTGRQAADRLVLLLKSVLPEI